MPKLPIYFGIVKQIKPTGLGAPRVQITPLYRQSEDGANWEPIENPRDDFQNRGSVTWFSADAQAGMQSLWQFSIETTPSFDRNNPTHDEHRVIASSAHPVREILDFRHLDQDDVRESLTKSGVLFEYVLAPHLFMRLEGNVWLGPLSLSRNVSNKWTIASVDFLLPCVAPILDDSLQTLEIENRRRTLVKPNVKPIPTIGQVDWSSDDILLKRVLSWIRKIDQAHEDALALTAKSIDSAVQAVFPEYQVDTSRLLVRQRLMRAQSIVADLEGKKTILSELESTIISFPRVKKQLIKVEEKTRKDALAEIETQLSEKRTLAKAEIIKEKKEADAKLKQIELQATEAQKKHEKAKLDFEEYERKVSNLKSSLENQVEQYEAEMTKRLADINSRPEQVLADLAILRAGLGVTANNSSGDPHAQKHDAKLNTTLLPWDSISLDAAPQQLDELAGWKPIARRRFIDRHLPSQIMGSLHASFLSGNMPVVSGTIALEVLTAYASLITENRVLGIPISPLTLECGDLFGKVDSSTKRFLPHPSGLADLVLRALQDDKLYLVVFEGINRAPTNSYLDPIVACYKSAWSKTTAARLSIFHPSLANVADPYLAIARFQWPRNILLAGTLSEGITLPISRSFWANASLINPEIYPVQEDTVATDHRTHLPYYVSLEGWQRWKEQIPTIDNSECITELSRIKAENVHLRLAETDQCLRFYRAAQTWNDSAVDSLEQMTVSCLVPLAVSGKSKRFRETIEKRENMPVRVKDAINMAVKMLL